MLYSSLYQGDDPPPEAGKKKAEDKEEEDGTTVTGGRKVKDTNRLEDKEALSKMCKCRLVTQQSTTAAKPSPQLAADIKNNQEKGMYQSVICLGYMYLFLKVWEAWPMILCVDWEMYGHRSEVITYIMCS